MTDTAHPTPTQPTPTPTPAGLLVIDKPLGRTSMDVCRIVRRKLVAAGAPKRVKVGHGGTLDPLATGVLVVLIGKATSMVSQVMDGQKVYETEVDFSANSTTDDLEGEKTLVPIGGEGQRAMPPTLDELRATCARFTGDIMQRPPIYSAMKVGGQRAYKLARKGLEVKLHPRQIRIDAIEVVNFNWPIAKLIITCGKGTYIRSLARDLGEAMQVGGMLTGLRRTRVGTWRIEEAKRVEDLPPTLVERDLLAFVARQR